MPRKSRKNTKHQTWDDVSVYLKGKLPHLQAWWDDQGDFREIRFKAKEDGTILAIAKGYGPDGGLLVCFGVGYDVIGAMLGIDGTIQAGDWREDKPWRPKG